MKKKVILAVVAMTIGIACNASDLSTCKNVSDEPEKVVVMDSIVHHHNEHSIDGNPCPCSNFSCSECGGQLEYSAKAYKEYTGKKCSVCKGEGCSTCDYEGLDWKWKAGCKCKKCGTGFVQPNDC